LTGGEGNHVHSAREGQKHFLKLRYMGNQSIACKKKKGPAKIFLTEGGRGVEILRKSRRGTGNGGIDIGDTPALNN